MQEILDVQIKIFIATEKKKKCIHLTFLCSLEVLHFIFFFFFFFFLWGERWGMWLVSAPDKKGIQIINFLTKRYVVGTH